MKRAFRRLACVALAAFQAVALAACGFHLRHSVQLPPSMQQVHLELHGDPLLRRDLAHQLEVAGVQLVGQPGPGVAELDVTRAQFGTNALTLTGRARISEYAVRYDVDFHVATADGRQIVPSQHIDMSREFTYDPTQTIGTSTQVEQLQDSLRSDMVQAIMFRLQARAHDVPASASTAR